jgi:hypothetical protein
MTCQYYIKTTIITPRLKPLQESDLKTHSYLHVLMLMSAISAFQLTQASTDADTKRTGLVDYPRIEHFEQGSVKVDFPTLDAWTDFRYLRAWLPVEVGLNGEDKPHVGSVYVQATTAIDFDQREVMIADLRVLKTRFFDEADEELLKALLTQAFHGRERLVPLDVLLRLLPEDFEIPGQDAETPRLSFDPPVILVSETPLRLLSIDKEPVRAPIEGTELEFVVNTNWNLFFHAAGERWYVLNDGTWQQNNYLSDGGWISTDNLPAGFEMLANNDNWPEVQKALPARKPESDPAPFVISLVATELILMDGSPRLNKIDDTGIHYVSNTQSDLFNYQERWYFLVSGRWFTSHDLKGQWQSVRNLPGAFAQIPAGHTKGHVLYSVPGTRQAKLAMIEAALPHRVSVKTDSAVDPDLMWVGEPRFEPIENTRLERGLNTPLQIIKHNNFYYLCHEGAWYLSAAPAGPFKPALQIPDEIYRIPATDPAYNVTFVRLDTRQDVADGHVNYNYSGGYTGNFSTTVSVVYGTGWYHPSSVFWGPGYIPYYWRYGSTYGHNVAYHPVGAYYGGRSGYYYPWGGWYGTREVTISSPTVEFTHGYGSAWQGRLQTTPGYPSDKQENSLDEFLPKKKIDGTEEFIDTSKEEYAESGGVSAASLYAGSALASTRFSGPDGEVYKHEDQQWSQYDDGNWATMQAIEQQYRGAPPPRQKAAPQVNNQWLPAHKRTLSRAELDRQHLARLEGMDNYSKYRMEREATNQK